MADEKTTLPTGNVNTMVDAGLADQQLLNQTAQNNKMDTGSAPLDLFDFRMKEQMTAIQQKGRPISTFDIYRDFVESKRMTPVVPSRDEALKKYQETFKTDKGFEQLYNYVDTEAKRISVKNWLSLQQRMSMPVKGPATPGGYDPFEPLPPSAPGEIQSGVYKTNALTGQQQVDAKQVYRAKDGTFKPIAAFNREGDTYLVHTPGISNEWEEADNDEATSSAQLRSVFGASDWNSDKLASIYRGFTQGLVGITATGTARAVEMVGDIVDSEDTDKWSDKWANEVSNWQRYYFGHQNEDEKKGILSGNVPAALYSISSGLGTILGAAAPALLTGGGAGLMSVAGGVYGAGMAYEQGKQEGLADSPGTATVAALIGVATGLIEHMSTRDVQALFKRKELYETLFKDKAVKAAASQNFTDAGKVAFVKDLIPKITKIADDMAAKKGVAGKAYRSFESGIVEGAEEELTRQAEAIVKNGYNLLSSEKNILDQTLINSKTAEIDADGKRDVIDMNNGKYYRYNEDYSQKEEISKDEYYQRRRNNAEQKRRVASMNSQYDTSVSQIFPFYSGEEFAGGFVPAFLMGLGSRAQTRQNRIFDVVAKGDSQKLYVTLDQMKKSGALGPANIDMVSGEVFDNGAANHGRTSINDFNYNTFKQEIRLAEEMLNQSRIYQQFKQGNRFDDYTGVSALKTEVMDNMRAQYLNESDYNTLTNDLSKEKDEAKKNELQAKINENRKAKTDLLEQYRFYTDASYKGVADENGVYPYEDNNTGYTRAFIGLAKDSILKYSGVDLKASDYTNANTFRNGKIKEMEEQAKEQAVVKAKSLQAINLTLEGLEYTGNPLEYINKLSNLTTAVREKGILSKTASDKAVANLSKIRTEAIMPLVKRITDDFAKSLTEEEKKTFAANDDPYMLMRQMAQEGDYVLPAMTDEEVQIIEKNRNLPQEEFFKATYSDIDAYTKLQQEQAAATVNDAAYYNRHAGDISNNLKQVEQGDADFLTKEHKDRLLSRKKELERDKSLLFGDTIYRNVNKNGIDNNLQKEIKTVAPNLSGDLKLHIDGEIEQAAGRYNALPDRQFPGTMNNHFNAIRKQIADIDRAVLAIDKKMGTGNIHELNIAHNDLLGKLFVFAKIAERTTKETADKINSVIASKEMQDAFASLNNLSADYATRKKAFDVADNAAIAVSAVIYDSGILLKKGKSGELLYKEVVDDFMSRVPVTKNNNFPYSGFYDFSDIGFENLMLSGIVSAQDVKMSDVMQSLKKNNADVKTINSISIVPFLGSYIANTLSSIAYVNQYHFHSRYASYAANETPTYQQLQNILFATAMLTGKNSGAITSYVDEKLGRKKEFAKNTISSSVMLMGYAGTGKTKMVIPEVVAAVKHLFNGKQRITKYIPSATLGASLDAALQKVTGITNNGTYTFDKFEKDAAKYNDGDIIIFDEATFIDKALFADIRNLQLSLEEKGKKVMFVFAGDESQASWDTGSYVWPPSVTSLSRSFPLTKIFRSGIADIGSLQSALRRGVYSLMSDFRIAFPGASYFSDGKERKGVRYSQTAEEVTDDFHSFIQNAKPDNSGQVKDVMFVVSTIAQKEAMVTAMPSSLGITQDQYAGYIYTLEKSKNMAPGLEAKVVFANIPNNTRNNRTFFQNNLSAATRAITYINMMWDDKSYWDRRQIGSQKANSPNDIIEVANIPSKEQQVESLKSFLQKTSSLKQYSNIVGALNKTDLSAAAAQKNAVTADHAAEYKFSFVSRIFHETEKIWKTGRVYKDSAFRFVWNLTTGTTTVTLPDLNKTFTFAYHANPGDIIDEMEMLGYVFNITDDKGNVVLSQREGFTDKWIYDFAPNARQGISYLAETISGPIEIRFENVMGTVVPLVYDNGIWTKQKLSNYIFLGLKEYVKKETPERKYFANDSYGGKKYVTPEGNVITGDMTDEKEGRGKYEEEDEMYFTFDGKPYKWIEVIHFIPFEEQANELAEAYEADTITGNKKQFNDDGLQWENGNYSFGTYNIIAPSGTVMSVSDAAKLRSIRAQLLLNILAINPQGNASLFYVRNNNGELSADGKPLYGLDDRNTASYRIGAYIAIDEKVLKAENPMAWTQLQQSIKGTPFTMQQVLYVSTDNLPNYNNSPNSKLSIEMLVSNIDKALEKIVNGFQKDFDEGDAYAKTNAKVALVKALVFAGRAAKQSGGLGALNYVRRGAVKYDKGQVKKLSDLAEEVKDWYELQATGVQKKVTLPNGNTTTKTFAVFKAKSDGRTIDIEVRSQQLTNKEISALSASVFPEEYLNKKGTDREFAELATALDGTDAVKTILYNRAGIRQHVPEAAELMDFDRNRIKGDTVTEKAENVKKILKLVGQAAKDKKSEFTFHKNPKAGIRMKGEVEVSMEGFTTHVTRIQNPSLAVPMPSVYNDELYQKYEAMVDSWTSAQDVDDSFTRNNPLEDEDYASRVNPDESFSADAFYSPQEMIDDVMRMLGDEVLFNNDNFVENLHTMTGDKAWALVRNGKILVDKNNGRVLRVLAAHEVQHVVFNYFLTQSQKVQLREAVNKVSGKNLTPGQADEWLSKKIESYDSATGKFASEDSFKGTLLERFFNWIKKIFGISDEDMLAGYFERIKSGYYRNYDPKHAPSESEEFAKKQNFNYANAYEVSHRFGGMEHFRKATQYLTNIIYGTSVLNNNITKVVEDGDYVSVLGTIRNMINGLVKSHINDTYIINRNGTDEQIKLSDVTAPLMKYINPEDAFYKNAIHYLMSRGNHFDYVVKSVVPDMDINAMKRQMKGDSMIQGNNLFFDGLGGISNMLKIILGGMSMEVNGKKVQVNVKEATEMLRDAFVESGNPLFNFSGKSRIELVGEYLNKQLVRSVSKNDMRTVLMQTLYSNIFELVNINLLVSQDGKALKKTLSKLSYYAIANQSEQITKILAGKTLMVQGSKVVDGKLVPVTETLVQSVEKRKDTAKKIVGSVESDIFSLDRKKYVSHLVKQIADKTVYFIRNFASANEQESVKTAKNNIQSRFYTKILRTHNIRPERITDFLGVNMSYEDGKLKITEEKQKRRYFVNTSTRTIHMRVGDNMLPFLEYYTDNGKLSFRLAQKANLYDDANADMRIMMNSTAGYVGLLGDMSRLTNRIMRMKQGEALGGDPEMTKDFFLEALGMFIVSAHNNALEEFELATEKNQQARKEFMGDTGFVEEPFNLRMNNMKADDSPVQEGEVTGDTDTASYTSARFLKPHELFIYINRLAKAKGATEGNKSYIRFTRNSKGTKQYIHPVSSWLSRIFSNGNRSASQDIASYISSILKDKKELTPYQQNLKDNLIVNNELVMEELITFTSAEGLTKALDYSQMTTADILDAMTFNFHKALTEGRARVVIPFTQKGERRMMFMGKFSKQGDPLVYVKNKGDGKYSFDLNGQYMWDYTKKRFGQFKNAAEYNAKIFSDKLVEYSDGQFKIKKGEARQRYNESIKFLTNLKGTSPAVYDIIVTRFVNDPSLNRTSDYVLDKGVLAPGMASQLFFDEEKGHVIYNSRNTEKFLQGYTYYEDEGSDTLDELFQPLYKDFVKMYRDSGYHVPSFLHYGLSNNDNQKTWMFAYDNRHKELLGQIKIISERTDVDDKQKEMMIAEVKKKLLGKDKEFSLILHPFYKALYFSFHLGDDQAGQLISGEDYMYSSLADYVKRGGLPTASGKFVSMSVKGGIGEFINTVAVDNRHPLFFYQLQNRIQDGDTFADRADGASFMNPLTAFRIRESNIEHVGRSSSMKLVDFNIDFNTGKVTAQKDSKVQITKSLLAFSPQLNDILKFMLGEEVYAKYLEIAAQNLSWEDTIRALNETVTDEQYQGMVHQVSPVTTFKVAVPSLNNMDDVLTGNRANIFVFRNSTRNLQIQQNAEQDYEKGDARYPSQIVSFLALGSKAIAQKVYEAMAVHAGRSVTDIQNKVNALINEDTTQEEAFGKVFREMQRSGTKVGATASMINNNRISLNFLNIIQQGLYNITSLFEGSIKPQITGSRLNQVPDIFTRVWDMDGQVLSGDDVARKQAEGVAVETMVQRQLNPMTYHRADGSRIQSKTDFDNAIKSGEKITVKPGEVLMAYSYVSKFNVQGLTLNQALSVQTDKGWIYVNENDIAANVAAILSSAEFNVIDPRFVKKDADGNMSEADTQQVENYFTALRHSLDLFVDRLPSHSFASGGIYKVVGFINDAGSSIITSPEKTFIDGSDFDIDQVSVFFRPFEMGADYSLTENNDPTKQSGISNIIFSGIWDTYTNPSSNVLDLMTSPTNMKTLSALAEGKRKDMKKQYETRGDLSSALYYHRVVSDGKQMTGIFANLVKIFGNLSYVVQAAPANVRQGLMVAFPALSAYRDSSGRQTADVIGEFLQSAMDNAKALILGYINISPTSNALVSSMVMEGKIPREVVDFITNPVVRELTEKMDRTRDLNNFDPRNFITVIRTMIEAQQDKMSVSGFSKALEDVDKEIKQREADYSAKSSLSSDDATFDEDSNDVPVELQEISELYSKRDQILRDMLTTETDADVLQNIETLKQARELMVKGEYLSRLGMAFGLNQGFDGGMYDLFVGTIGSLEWYAGKKLEDFGTATAFDYKERFRNYKQKGGQYNDAVAREEAIRALPAIDSVANVLPHISQYIAMLSYIRKMMGNFFYFNPDVEMLKSRMLSLINESSFTNEEQYRKVFDALEDMVLDLFFTLEQKQDIPLLNSYYTDNFNTIHPINRYHNVSTADGRAMFLVDFADKVKVLLSMYDRLVGQGLVKKNAFLDELRVSEKGTGGQSCHVMLNNSDMEDDDKIIVRNAFSLLQEAVNDMAKASSVFAAHNFHNTDIKNLFRTYNILKYGFIFRHGTLADVITSEVNDGSKDILEDISAFIDGKLVPSMNNDMEAEEGSDAQVINDTMDSFADKAILYNPEIATRFNLSKGEEIDTALSVGNANLSEGDVYVQAVYGDPRNAESAERYTQQQFIDAFVPKYVRMWNRTMQRDGIHIRYEINKGTKDFQVAYKPLFLTFPKNAKPYTTDDAVALNSIPTVRTMEPSEIRLLRQGQKVNFATKNTNDYFSGRDIKDGILSKPMFVPLVGMVDVSIQPSKKLITITPLNTYTQVQHNVFEATEVMHKGGETITKEGLAVMNSLAIGQAELQGEFPTVDFNLIDLYRDYNKMNDAMNVTVEEYIEYKKESQRTCL